MSGPHTCFHDALAPTIARHERQFVDLVNMRLTTQRWPFDRLRVVIRFDTTKDPLLVRPQLVRYDDGALGGSITGRVNALFLERYPDVYLSHLGDHLSAHFCSLAAAARANIKIKHRGPEWRSWLSRINTLANPRHGELTRAFDDRPLTLFRGGVACRCGCDGDTGLHALSTITVRRGGRVCTVCHQPLRAFGPDEPLPGHWADDLRFLERTIRCRQQQRS